MNKNNKEVEFKYRVKNKSKLLKWLRKNAKKAYEYRQVDRYYTPPHKNFFDKEYPNEYLRIRQSGDKFSITYKYWYAMKGTNEHSHCDEYETDVENGEQMKKIFKALDFKLLVIVDKHRTAYNYQNFEIEIDNVKSLGFVCEIELKDGYKTIEDAHRMIRKLARELGFAEKDRGADLKLGYAFLIAKKKGIV
ncbi:class IV adenylate cyclase [Candidatus Dojkabacteria bacterium]|nr:class IV adenylate cyclase [Candidatus Dojkabacteria bacterium]